jgi:hypothetical protein
MSASVCSTALKMGLVVAILHFRVVARGSVHVGWVCSETAPGHTRALEVWSFYPDAVTARIPSNLAPLRAVFQPFPTIEYHPRLLIRLGLKVLLYFTHDILDIPTHSFRSSQCLYSLMLL